MDKARHAFGALENIDSAISAGTIDAFDVLFVKDANGKAYVGWVDKDGNKVIVGESNGYVDVEGDTLPETGEKGQIYVCGEEAYIWNGTEFVNLCKSADLSTLETQIGELETQIGTKVDEETVDAKIKAAMAVDIVEF